MKPGFNWIDDLSAPARTAMHAAASIHDVAAGTLLCQQGDRQQEFYQIITGQIRQFVVTFEGDEVLVYLYRNGDVVGDIVVLDREPYPVSIAAQGKVKLRVWSLAAFEPLRAAHPEVDAAIALQMARRLRSVLARLEEISTLSVGRRVTQRLLSLMKITGAHQLDLSQADLALAAGTSRQTVNKVLQSLRKQGLIESRYGGITILVPDGLRNYRDDNLL